MSPWTNYFIRKMWSLVHYRVVVWAKHDASCFEISVLKLKVTLQCQVCEICFAEHTSRKPEGVSLYFLCTSNNCLKGWSFLFWTFYFDYPFFLQWFEVAVWLKATLVLQSCITSYYNLSRTSPNAEGKFDSGSINGRCWNDKGMYKLENSSNCHWLPAILMISVVV